MWHWMGGGSSNASLVQHLITSGRVASPRVADAMRAVDRGKFVAAFPGAEDKAHAYLDSPLSIGSGQTISAPHMHAAVLDILEDCLTPGASVLDVGSGSGIMLPYFWALVRPGGRVLGVDKHASLVDASRAPVAAAAPDGVASGAVELRVANVLAPGALGDDATAAFDVIHVGAAAAEVPAVLVAALKPGGKMVLPVGPDGGDQQLQLVTKGDDGVVRVRSLMGVRYVPLTPPGQDKYGGL